MRAYLIVRDDYTLYDKSFQIGEYVTFEKTFPAPALDSPVRAMKFFWKAPQLNVGSYCIMRTQKERRMSRCASQVHIK